MKRFIIVIFAALLALVFAFPALAYSDDDAISYPQAVAALSERGLLDGYPDGSFCPAQSVTREQGAKLLCCLLLGTEQAAKLSADGAPFADVAAGRWSAGCIAYGAKQGMISGYAGKYSPMQGLNTAAWCKLLLHSLGYGVQGEYTGAGWAQRALADGRELGLLNGDTDNLVMGTALNREQAALLLYNTLSCSYVEWRGDAYVDAGHGTPDTALFGAKVPVEEPQKPDLTLGENEMRDNMVFYVGNYSDVSDSEGRNRTYEVYYEGYRAGVTYKDGVDCSLGWYNYPKSGLNAYTGQRAVYPATVALLNQNSLTLTDVGHNNIDLVITDKTIIIDLTEDKLYTSLNEAGKTVTVAANWSEDAVTGVRSVIAIYIMDVQ